MDSKLKTHTFRLGKYKVHLCGGLDGVTDAPDKVPWSKNKDKNMYIGNGRGYIAFHTALHEAMHAENIPDNFLHDREGFPDTHRLAKFLWRLFKITPR